MFPFQYLICSLPFPSACRVSADRSAHKRMGLPVYVTCCFSLAAFNILSLYLIFVNLISVCISVFLLGFIFYGTPLHLFALDCLFPFHVGEIFNCNLFKIFLICLLFLFFFCDPYNLNAGAFDIVPEVSETTFSSFHSFFFILLFRSQFHHFLSSLIHSSVSDILLLIPSRMFFNFSNCVVCLCMLIL